MATKKLDYWRLHDFDKNKTSDQPTHMFTCSYAALSLLRYVETIEKIYIGSRTRLDSIFNF